MQTSVTFTANIRTGTTTRLSLAIKRLGYKFVNVTMKRSPDDQFDIVTFLIESENMLSNKDFSTVVESLKNVVRVNVGQLANTQAQGATHSKPAANRTMPARQPAPPPAKPAVPIQRAAPVPVELPKIITEDDKAKIVKTEGRRLIGEYPKIRRSLIALDSEFDPTVRSELMQRIGKALGQWQFKKNYNQGAGLDSTVRGSLQIYDSNFKASPVISSLISAGAKKDKKLEAATADPLTQLENVLSDFLNVSIVGDTIRVVNCPHCASSRPSEHSDCYFVSQFIQGFILDIDELESAYVVQVASQKTGGESCQFEIKRTN